MKELTGEEKFAYLKKTAWKFNNKNWSELKQEDREAVEHAYVAQKIEEGKAPKVAPKEEPKKVKGLQEKGFGKPIIIDGQIPEEAIADSSEDSVESGAEEAVSEEAPEASESDEAPELPDPVATKTKPKKTRSRF